MHTLFNKASLNFIVTLLMIIFFGKIEAQNISINEEIIDYGVIKKGSNGERNITVSNTGSSPLILTNCTASCGCTVPICPREPIMPGKSAKVSVRYDTNRLGPFTKMVTINSNDPSKQSIAVKIQGEVKE